MKKRIIVGVSGASGALYAKLLIQQLHRLHEQVESVDLIFSEPAREVWAYELENTPLTDLPFKIWDNRSFWSPLASGSASFDAMAIIPCSMGTLGRIASGQANDLMTRTADVMLKERVKLILVSRESPLNLIHIRNMETITLAGGIILPASPSFYDRPESIDQLAYSVVYRVLKVLGLESGKTGFMEKS